MKPETSANATEKVLSYPIGKMAPKGSSPNTARKKSDNAVPAPTESKEQPVAEADAQVKEIKDDNVADSAESNAQLSSKTPKSQSPRAERTPLQDTDANPIGSKSPAATKASTSESTVRKGPATTKAEAKSLSTCLEKVPVDKSASIPIGSKEKYK